MKPVTSLIYLFLAALAVTSASPDTTCECGIENVSRRIIRGRSSIEYQFPWMVYIKRIVMVGRQMGVAGCTGSVINDRFILTAAHCLQGTALYTGAFIGMHCKNDPRSMAGTLKVKRVIYHERYREVRGFHDIGLIELEEPLKFNGTFSPICLPNFVGHDNFVAAGWGQVESWNPWRGTTKEETDCLREADLDVVHPSLCRRFHPYLNEEKALCAGGRTNVCQGDSGGPLMTRNNGNVYQVGITSFGRADCGIVTETPAIFEKVSAHYDWIKSKTRGAKWCTAKRSTVF